MNPSASLAQLCGWSGTLGIAPALASVAAVIVVRRFSNSSLDQVCQIWATSLA